MKGAAPLVALAIGALAVSCSGARRPSIEQRAAPVVTVSPAASAAFEATPAPVSAAPGTWQWAESGLLWMGGSTISVWQLDPLELIAERTAPAEVACAALSPTGTLLLATTDSGERPLWDLRSGARSSLPPEPDNPWQACQGDWLPGGAWVERSSPVILALHANGRSEAISECVFDDFDCVAASADGSWISMILHSGIRLQRPDGSDQHVVRGNDGFWTATGLFVAVDDRHPVRTALWDPQAKRQVWSKRGVHAFSASPEGDRLLVVQGSNDSCGQGTWSVLASRTGRVITTFKRQNDACCADFGWMRRGDAQTSLVFYDSSRLLFVAPSGNSDAHSFEEECSGPLAVGQNRLTAGQVLLDVPSLTFGTAQDLVSLSLWSAGDEFLAGSTDKHVAIWDGRTGAVLRSVVTASEENIRWVSASALLYQTDLGGWLCLLSTVDPRKLCLTVVQDGEQQSILALADDGTYSQRAAWTTLDDRMKELADFQRPSRLCPNLLGAYLRGQRCEPARE